MLAGDVKQALQVAEIQGVPPFDQVAGEDFRRAFVASVSTERASAANGLTADRAQAKVSDLAAGDGVVRGRIQVSSAALEKSVGRGSKIDGSARLATTTKTITAATAPSPLATFAGTASRLAATSADSVTAATALKTADAKSTAALHAEEDSAAPVSAGELGVIDLGAAGANVQRICTVVAAAPQTIGADYLPSTKTAAQSQQKTTGAARTHDEKHVPKTDVIGPALASIAVQAVAKPEAAGDFQPIKIAEPVDVSFQVQTFVGVSGNDGAVKISPALGILPGTRVGNAAPEVKNSVVSVVRDDLQAIPLTPASQAGFNRTPVDATRSQTAQYDAATSTVVDAKALHGPKLPFKEASTTTNGAAISPVAALKQTSKEAGPKPVPTAGTISPLLAVSASGDSKFTHSLVQVATNSSEGSVGSDGRIETGRGAPPHGLKSVAREAPEEFAPTSVLPRSASALPAAEVAATETVERERATSYPAAASVTTLIDAKRAGAGAGSTEPPVGPVSSQRWAQVTPANTASVAASDDSALGNKETASTVRVEAPSAIVAATDGSVSNSAVAAWPSVPAGAHRESVSTGSIAETSIAGAATRLAVGTVSDFATASDAHRTLIATPTTLEVGVRDGGQGWLKIRAEVGGAGGVTASLAAASSGGQEMLKGQLPALNEYLHNEHMMVTTTVAERSFVTSASGLAGLATGADGSGGSHSPGSSHGYNGQGQMDGGLSQGGDQRKAGGEFASDPERRYDRGAGIAGAELVSGVSAMMNAQFAAPEENGYRLNVRV